MAGGRESKNRVVIFPPGFLVCACLKPSLAVVFFLGFGGFFVFGGFQSATVQLQRDIAGTVNGRLTRSHFSGLYTVSRDLRGITRAAIETGEAHPRFLLASAVSRVALVSESNSTPIFAGFSNVDEADKRRIARTVNQYLGRGDDRAFHETFRVRNMFGWVGLPFFLIGIYAVLSWPVTIVWCWRKHVGAAADAPV